MRCKYCTTLKGLRNRVEPPPELRFLAIVSPAKTGTSRKASAGGYSDEYVALTAGVAPVSRPRVSLVVVINEPQGDQYYGGSVAGPVFSEIMKGALQILNVAPDENQFQ